MTVMFWVMMLGKKMFSAFVMLMVPQSVDLCAVSGSVFQANGDTAVECLAAEVGKLGKGKCQFFVFREVYGLFAWCEAFHLHEAGLLCYAVIGFGVDDDLQIKAEWVIFVAGRVHVAHKEVAVLLSVPPPVDVVIRVVIAIGAVAVDNKCVAVSVGRVGVN